MNAERAAEFCGVCWHEYKYAGIRVNRWICVKCNHAAEAFDDYPNFLSEKPIHPMTTRRTG